MQNLLSGGSMERNVAQFVEKADDGAVASEEDGAVLVADSWVVGVGRSSQ